MRSPTPIRHDLILVGGGHANVQVLRRWAMAPVAGVRLTVVVDRPVAVYSGMVPGFVAGQYRRDELEIDVRPLARRAGARFVVAPAVGLDPVARRLRLDGRPPLPYDTAAFDVGSTVAGLELPGVAAHALPTRPIGDLVRRTGEVLARARGTFRVTVVGAGAGGVELAFAFQARLVRSGVVPSVTLLEAGGRVLPGSAAGAARRVMREAARRGIAIRLGARVVEATADAVRLADGTVIETDALVWVAGAASHRLFADAGLETDDRGFVRVGPTLQCVGHPELFAVGDCASLVHAPGLPKAGVYAVRAGPVLAGNLYGLLTGGALREYHPQRHYLSLLNLGDGRAIGAKWGLTATGRAVFRLKDAIDRRFMRRFQVLDAEGGARPGFQSTMTGADVPCGGCAAKVGEAVLARALARVGVRADPAVVLGLTTPDDAAAVVTRAGSLVVSSVDAFRAFTDDPWLTGRVAAVNAASDLWAKGVAPRFAQAVITLPDEDPARAEETLVQVLAGARATFDPAGVTLVGGHTTTGDDLGVGFAVFGEAPAAGALLRKAGLVPGDRLVLTKPLGTGVLFRADMQGRARGEWIEAAVASMLRTNAAAADVARELRASASTDVSGFGLAGHLAEMLRASGVAATLDTEALPLLPGVAALLARGVRSTFHAENARRRAEIAGAGGEVVFDPQTSGGLLLGFPAARAGAAVAALHGRGDRAAAIVGEVTAARADGVLIALR